MARAIAASGVPVISAVGHEIDFTIADFVADIRAATPTAAAEIAVRNRADLLQYLSEASSRLHREVWRRLDGLHDRLGYLLKSRGMSRPRDLVREYQQQLDELAAEGTRTIGRRLQRLNDRLHRLESSLRALDPEAVLRRGYAIIRKEGEPVTSASELGVDDRIEIALADGSRKAEIVE